MKDIKLARVLLDSAGANIFSLRSTVDTPGYPEEIFGFHVQQAAEKSFRAWLCLLNERYPVSQDLALLSGRVKAVDAQAARFDELISYTPYADEFRYVASTKDEPLERSTALRLSEEFVKHVEKMLEEMKENQRETFSL